MKKRSKTDEQLVYDETTKLLTIEQIDSNKFKIFLEKNKIYFETLMMLIISIAGIIVSVVGVRVDVAANNISLEEKRIEDLEKQPSFVYDVVVDENEAKYIVKNVGGDIKYGQAICDEVLIVSIYYDYNYIGKGYIYFSDYFTKDFSKYDFETDSFVFTSSLDPKPITEWADKIDSILRNKGFTCSFECTTCFYFTYKDYKQEEIQRNMFLRGGEFYDVDDSERNDFIVRVGLNDLENKNIDKILMDEFELLEMNKNYHKSGGIL